MRTHDFFQGIDAIHARHFQIECDHVRLQLFNLFQAEASIHRGSNYLDGRVSFEDLRDELSHKGGIIHYQHAYFHARFHACTPPAPRASATGVIQQEPPAGHARRFRTRARDMFHNREQIQDQYNFSIAKNGSAVYQVGRESVVIQSLDDQLFFAFQSVDSQTVLILNDGNYQDEQLARLAVGIDRRTTQAQQRKYLVPQLQHFVVVDLMDFGFKCAGNLADGV